ncbi:MAG: type II secretion system protein GspL [Myxococcota bacterium]
MLTRRILGLDLGSHAAKAVELRQTLRGVEVTQLRHLLLPAPVPSLGAELGAWIQEHDLPRENVVVSLAGDRISSRRLSFPFKDRRKIGPAVPFELEGQVPFELDDYFVDWEITGQRKSETEVVATLAAKSEVRTLLEQLGDADLSPHIVEAEGLVLSNLGSVFDLPGARLLADIGHRKTTLCLCVDGRAVASRTVPLAGLAITRALAQDRGVDEAAAERVKLEEGVGAANASALAALERLAREILRTVGSLEALLPGGSAGLQAVHLLGGSGRLHRLDEFLAERTGLPTKRLPLPAGELGAAFLAGGDPLLYGPAMALALRGSSQAATRMNLRQGELGPRIDYRQVGRELRPTLWLAVAALGLGLLSVGTKLALDARRAEALEAQARALVAQALPDAAPGADPMATMQAAVRSAQRRADTLGVYRGNLSALDILTEISKRVPSDLDVIFEELSIDRQVIQIKGHSPSFGSVDALRGQLAQFEPFAEITVGDITADARRGGQNFNVRISLSADGDAS